MNSSLSSAVSIHPYFKIKEGKLDAFRALIGEFTKATESEDLCLYYDFFLKKDSSQAYCREGYVGAKGVLTHLENVGSCIEAALEIAELYRLEIHGPAEEIAQLEAPLADLNPEFYIHSGGVLGS